MSSESSPASDSSFQYASWARRASGFFLDILPAVIVSSWANAEYFTVAGFGTDQDWANGQNYFVEVSGPGWAYYLLHSLAIAYWFVNKGLVEGATGKSWAKHVLGMRTVDGINVRVHRPIGAWRGLARAFLVYVEFASIILCGLGLVLWLWPLWQARVQALLSDRALNVVVVRG